VYSENLIDSEITRKTYPLEGKAAKHENLGLTKITTVIHKILKKSEKI